MKQPPILRLSDPEACTPDLLTFSEFGERDVQSFNQELLSAKGREGNTHFAILNTPKTDGVFLQVYGGVRGNIRLQAAAVYEKGIGEQVTDELMITEVATTVRFRSSAATRYLISFEVEEGQSAKAFVSLAAYIEIPKPQGSIPVRKKHGECEDEEPVNSTTINCGGTATQRLVLTSCDGNRKELESLVKDLRLEVSEEYHGPLGSVVAVGLPPGLDLDTTGGAANEKEITINTNNLTIEPDFLINLFYPDEPTKPDGKLPRAGDDPEIKETICDADDYFREQIPPPDEPPAFDKTQDPLLVAIIDSGVDLSPENRKKWDNTVYSQRKETEFIKPGKLGYDFIDDDFEPEDVTPHGTYVAASLLNQYRSERPLNLIHLKTFGKGGISTYFGALVAIYEAAAVGCKVINMSWGIAQKEPPAGLQCAIATAVKQGVHVVTSAGNSTKDIDIQPQWPAAFSRGFPFSENIITVASYWYQRFTYNRDPNKIDLKDFSNYGDEATTLAAFMTTPVPEAGSGNIIFPLGTSISAPIVAGLLANFLADHPGGTLTDFLEKYTDFTSPITDRILKGRFIPLDHSLSVMT